MAIVDAGAGIDRLQDSLRPPLRVTKLQKMVGTEARQKSKAAARGAGQEIQALQTVQRLQFLSPAFSAETDGSDTTAR